MRSRKNRISLQALHPMKIGLVSDTHGFYEPKMDKYLAGCDEIWHGGDIGSREIIGRLELLSRVRAVHGNIDGLDLRNEFPENAIFYAGGIKVMIRHICGSPPSYNPDTRKLILDEKPDLLVCGHSHILKVITDPKYNNLLFINPGAAGNHGFHKIKTIITFQIEGKKVKDMKAIELGKRGEIQQ
jgi:uncharacterized protein